MSQTMSNRYMRFMTDMNERFKALAEQAWPDLPKHWWDRQDGMVASSVTKFAELIVAECIEQVRGQYEPVKDDVEMMKDPMWQGYVHCGVDSVVAIREHFDDEKAD